MVIDFNKPIHHVYHYINSNNSCFEINLTIERNILRKTQNFMIKYNYYYSLQNSKFEILKAIFN